MKSKQEVLDLLLGVANQLGTLAAKSNNLKVARQLMGLSLVFLDVAKRIKIGALQLPEDTDSAAGELDDVIRETGNAAPDAAMVVVEAYEALAMFDVHLNPGPAAFALAQPMSWQSTPELKPFPPFPPFPPIPVPPWPYPWPRPRPRPPFPPFPPGPIPWPWVHDFREYY